MFNRLPYFIFNREHLPSFCSLHWNLLPSFDEEGVQSVSVRSADLSYVEISSKLQRLLAEHQAIVIQN